MHVSEDSRWLGEPLAKPDAQKQKRRRRITGGLGQHVKPKHTPTYPHTHTHTLSFSLRSNLSTLLMSSSAYTHHTLNAHHTIGIHTDLTGAY